MVPVKGSSSIDAIGYDGPTKTLHVHFKSGKYIYSAVPPRVFFDMMQAPSKGKFLRTFIKDKFQHTKIE